MSVLLYVLFLSVLNDLIVALFLPQCKISFTWIIPVYFALFYSLAFCFAGKCKGVKSADGIMLFKTVKLIVSVAVMLTGVFALKAEVKPFLVTFLVYYFLMLLPEVYFSLSKRNIFVDKYNNLPDKEL